MEYKCVNCGKIENIYRGLWNKEPRMFFCSIRCYDEYMARKK